MGVVSPSKKQLSCEGIERPAQKELLFTPQVSACPLEAVDLTKANENSTIRPQPRHRHSSFELQTLQPAQDAIGC